MRHKQILDVAAEHPDASMKQLASMVPSATADLVQHVPDEHGGPGADDATEAVSPAPTETQPQSKNDGDEQLRVDRPMRPASQRVSRPRATLKRQTLTQTA